jgi:hypothetical protein
MTEPPSTYTKADLLAQARAAGSPVSRRLIDDWVAKGLLDRPHVQGLGRGKGTTAVWLENQRRLFLLLLNKRGELKQTSGRSRVLPNIPVALWLYFGDDYVPLRQVRRALRTYCEAWRQSQPGTERKPHWTARSPAASRRRSEATARRLIGLLVPPNLSRARRAELRRELVDAGANLDYEHELDRDRLLAVTSRVLDPDNIDRSVGPTEARVTPENWTRTIEARLTALQNLDAIDNSTFEDVRVIHNNTLAAYSHRQPDLARDPDIGKLFEPLTFEALANNACVELLTGLGMLELARQSGKDHDNSPPRRGNGRGHDTERQSFDAESG